MLKRQPNSDDCFACGRKNPRGLYMTFYDDGERRVVSRYTVDPLYQSYPGIVHGGVVATMLDEVVGRVAIPISTESSISAITSDCWSPTIRRPGKERCWRHPRKCPNRLRPPHPHRHSFECAWKA